MSDIEPEASQSDDLLEIDEMLENNPQPEGSQTTSKNTQRHKHCRKSTKPPAKCWKYFEIEGEDSICKVKIKKPNGEEQICGKSYKYLPGGSTTNMNSHLADEHDLKDFQKKQ
ncbi:7820_t:CDS:1, partial [Cetraspora pellucida]